MGLDQNAYICKPEDLDSEVDFSTEEIWTSEIAYWRKHANLQGWMNDLYSAKGGKDEYFNVSPVRLTLGDIYALEDDILNDTLPETTGFFFGVSGEHHKYDDLEFIKKAKKAINDGYAVFYCANY